MKHYLLAAALLLTSSTATCADEFSQDAVRACIVGGGVVAVASVLVLSSAAAFGATAVPVTVPAATAIVISNTAFGCGVGTIGTMLVLGAHSLYTKVVTGEPQPKAAH
jgi:hypothetical protein